MKLTKDILLIVLVLGLTVPKGIFHFVIHLPDLVEHYYEHKTENEQVSLLDFIAEHIGQPNHEHTDKHAHDDLPFNHQHTSDYNQSWTAILFFNKETLKHSPTSSLEKITTCQCFHSSEFSQSIWQPPKMS